MLQSMGSQRIGHNLATEQQQWKNCRNKIPLTGWLTTHFSLTRLEARNPGSSWQQIWFLLRAPFPAFVLPLCSVSACSAVSSYKDMNSSRKRLHPLLILITSLEDPSAKAASLGVKVSTHVRGQGGGKGEQGPKHLTHTRFPVISCSQKKNEIIWMMARVTIFVCLLNWESKEN